MCMYVCVYKENFFLYMENITFYSDELFSNVQTLWRTENSILSMFLGKKHFTL